MASKPRRKRKVVPPRPVVGWREWVRLPDLGIRWIKSKVDTGARTSSLHAIHIEHFRNRGVAMVRFQVHPYQRDFRRTVTAEAPLVETRMVRASSGHASKRPVILTSLTLMDETWPIELTLASRDAMGFRMLLGREALRRRFAVDPGRSFVNGKPPRKKKRKKKP